MAAKPRAKGGATVKDAAAKGEPAAKGELTAKGERIAKRLARIGVASRRGVERMIADGRIAVDGEILTTPAVLVTDASHITVDGDVAAAIERTRLWRYHKPRGEICTDRDPQGRPTIFDQLPPGLPRLISVGRLDLNSEGLLLLTNDGGLARTLELPATGWLRRYRVRVFGKVEPKRLAGLGDGIEISGIRYSAITARLDSTRGDNSWITMTLAEGKNREVRRVMEHLDLRVNRLIRTAYGSFQLARLEPGALSEVPAKVVANLIGDEKNARHRR